MAGTSKGKGYTSPTKTSTTTTRSGSLLGRMQQDQVAGRTSSPYVQRAMEVNSPLTPTQAQWNAMFGGYGDSYSGPSGTTSGTTSGGRSWGGGGGGGGPKPLTQDSLLAMIRAVNQPVNQTSWNDWNYQQWKPAAYEGTPVSAWDDSLFRQAETALGQGYDNAHMQRSGATDYARDALARNDQLYADLRAQAQPTFTPRMQGGISTLGGDPRVVNEANMNAAAADTAFTRFLGANDLVNANSQTSRRHEANLADQFFLNQLNQQKLADQTGLGIARTKDKQRWQERADERAYADSVLGQQWGREASQANWQGANQAGQFNATGRNTTGQFNAGAQNTRYNTTLNPILELIKLANEYGLDPSALGV